ncbi:FtsK/SpoIIIE domain-containing protein [Thalassobacillus sp. CUG 92003]|uniref:FtsK/SpoIIIE domain-containing protein n=1 Tax=Thalassobacillus sp. CUG 92003 TaxID=2736641 RepID=UPI0015E7BBF5|nr:FtsK/SpoIIIE domain-containing protein [Thalassobacillus sp. CUG 92003]
MFVEIGTTVLMAGVAGYSYLKTNGGATNEGEKIQRIFANAGWNVRDANARIHRKRKIEGGVEYVVQLPLGVSSRKIIENKAVIEDGLNVRGKYFEFDPRDFLTVEWAEGLRPALEQIRKIITEQRTKRKEIDVTFDGMLCIKVYDEPLTDNLPWSDAYLTKGWRVIVGKSRSSDVYHNFEKRPHMIVAGATGFGKSQFLKLLITSLVRQKPTDVSFTLIDLKGGTAFQRFRNMTQVSGYATGPEEALDELKAIQRRMSSVLRKLVQNGHEDVIEAGIPDRHFVIIDEAADLSDNDEAMEIITDLSRQGRGAGVRLIYATQYPTNETLPSQVRQNIGGRVCFVLETNAASRAVLDEGGAEDLPEIEGRAIYRRVKNVIIQTPYITNKEVERQVKPHINVKAKGGDRFEQKRSERTEDRKHPLIVEKV